MLASSGEAADLQRVGSIRKLRASVNALPVLCKNTAPNLKVLRPVRQNGKPVMTPKTDLDPRVAYRVVWVEQPKGAADRRIH